jgi:hypothetical protein
MILKMPRCILAILIVLSRVKIQDGGKKS